MRKARYWLGGIALVGFTALGIAALQESSVAYATIEQARTAQKTVQIKGTWVQQEPLLYDTRQNLFRFTLRDETGATIPVRYHGPKPNNFELAESVVVRGRVEGAEFVATQILTKCPSKYEGGEPLPQ